MELVSKGTRFSPDGPCPLAFLCLRGLFWKNNTSEFKGWPIAAKVAENQTVRASQINYSFIKIE